jgi:hypothetical protein
MALLSEANIDPYVIEQLLKSEILMPSIKVDFCYLNRPKIERILSGSEDLELVEFLTWLKSISGDATEILQKDPKNMSPGTQDIKV